VSCQRIGEEAVDLRPVPSRPALPPLEGTVLVIEQSIEGGLPVWTWSCPVCSGVVKAHTSDHNKALLWISRYAPHPHARLNETKQNEMDPPR
jgi:hypothetical protein